MTIQMKATEQYFPVVLFTTLYKVVLAFDSADEILKWDHSNKAFEQDSTVVLFKKLYKVVISFMSVDEFLNCDQSSFEPHFSVGLFVCLFVC